MAPAVALNSGPEGGRLPKFQTLRDYIEHLRNLERAFYLRASRSSLDEDLGPWDLETPIPALQSVTRDTTFVALDLEGPHSAISEVGLARISLSTIRVFAPGKQGHRWLNKSTSRHYRVEELKDYRGRRGNPESYSRSRFVPKAELRKSIELALQKYTSGGMANFVLVGHGVHNDIEKLKKILDLDIETMPGFQATLDTEKLYSAYLKEQQHMGRLPTQAPDYWRWPKSLEIMANAFDLHPHDLHNAAWDAFFTLAAMLAILTGTISSRKQGSDMQQFFYWSDRVAVTYHAIPLSRDVMTRAMWLENLILGMLDKSKSVLIVHPKEEIVAMVSGYLHGRGICHSRLHDMPSATVRSTTENFKLGINRIVMATTSYFERSDLVADQIVVIEQTAAVTSEDFWKGPESYIRSRKISRAFRTHDPNGCDVQFYIGATCSGTCERLYSQAPVSTEDHAWMQKYEEWKERRRLVEQDAR